MASASAPRMKRRDRENGFPDGWRTADGPAQSARERMAWLGAKGLDMTLDALTWRLRIDRVARRHGEPEWPRRQYPLCPPTDVMRNETGLRLDFRTASRNMIHMRSVILGTAATCQSFATPQPSNWCQSGRNTALAVPPRTRRTSLFCVHSWGKRHIWAGTQFQIIC